MVVQVDPPRMLHSTARMRAPSMRLRLVKALLYRSPSLPGVARRLRPPAHLGFRVCVVVVVVVGRGPRLGGSKRKLLPPLCPLFINQRGSVNSIAEEIALHSRPSLYTLSLSHLDACVCILLLLLLLAASRSSLIASLVSVDKH